MSSNSQFFYSGIRHSFSGNFENSGWIFGTMQGAGAYRYRNTAVPDGSVRATFTVVEAAFGYQHRWDRGGIAVLAGFHDEYHGLSADDPGNQVQGEASGPSLLIDIWSKPNADTLITAYASATSVFGGYYGRVFAGRRVSWLRDGFLGPEWSLMGNDTYWEMRMGGQLNSVTIGPWGLSAALGMSHNQDSKNSLYGAFSFLAEIRSSAFH
ncbi:MAG: cellulose biosynthesis protein BcsS [Fimbriimonadaceae bacterium]|nr:cellulose biosynthesis protein BcsS [Alphaproteobacteria bacterium]